MFSNPDEPLDIVVKLKKQYECGNCFNIVPLGLADRKEEGKYVYIRCPSCGQLCRVDRKLFPK